MRKLMWAFIGALAVLVLGLVILSISAVYRWWAAPEVTGGQIVPVSTPTVLAATPAASPLATVDPLVTDPAPALTAGPLTAAEIAARSAERMSAMQTFHFSLLADGAPYYVDSYMDSPVPVTLQGVEGDVQRPDRMQAQIQVSSFGLKMSAGLVKVGQTTYMNDPLTGSWQQLPAQESQALDLAAMFDPQQGLPALLTRYDSTLIGAEAINGQPAYHLAIANPSEVLIPDTQGATAVEVWVDQASFVIHRIVLTGLDPKTGQIAVWRINLWAFEQPVTIVPPPL